MSELSRMNLAIYYQRGAIRHTKALRQHYLDNNQKDLASYIVNVLVEQESVLTYLITERENLKSEKKEKN